VASVRVSLDELTSRILGRYEFYGVKITSKSLAFRLILAKKASNAHTIQYYRPL